jgi:hypothetical protein
MTSAMISKIKQGIAPCRGMAEGLVLLSVDFFLIFGAAIQKQQTKANTDRFPCLFLEQAIKRGAGIVGVARRWCRSVFAGLAHCAGGQGVAGHGHSR